MVFLVGDLIEYTLARRRPSLDEDVKLDSVIAIDGTIEGPIEPLVTHPRRTKRKA